MIPTDLSNIWSLGLMGFVWIYFNKYGFSHAQWIVQKIMPILRSRMTAIVHKFRTRKERAAAEAARQRWLRSR